MRRTINLVGEIYGKLLVLKQTHNKMKELEKYRKLVDATEINEKTAPLIDAILELTSLYERKYKEWLNLVHKEDMGR